MVQTHRLRRSSRLLGAVALAAGCLSWLAVSAPASAASGALNGTFVLTSGSCSGGAASGTYLRMILPSGSASGPFMSNSDSRCGDQTYTTLSAGTDRGLIVGSYQPMPSPPFDSNGNALARRITAPATFEGTSFATSTNSVDPQTHQKVPAPSVTVHGSKVSADLRGFAVTWNRQYFNQGSPKPNGADPGNTRPASGTYDAATGAMTLTWTSQVVGGPFDKFTGYWHLEGHFVPAGGSSSGGGSHSSHSSGKAGGGTASGGSGSSSSSGQTSTTTSGGTSGATTTATTTGHHSRTVGAGDNPPATGSTGSAPSGGAGVAPAVAATTNTQIHDGWRASWWLIALVAAIAVLGFGTLIGLNRIQRRTPAAS